MPVQVGLTSITGITTSISSTDAVSKQYVDNLPSSLPSVSGKTNQFLYTDGSNTSWQPIDGVQEYTAAGTYTFTVPNQAKEFLIEATGAGGGGASGNNSGSSYQPASLWTQRTSGFGTTTIV